MRIRQGDPGGNSECRKGSEHETTNRHRCGHLRARLRGERRRGARAGRVRPGQHGCPVATYSNGVLHLEKNCPTPTNAAAGADITGLNGQTFQSASFTLASTSQCQGGSPRFNVVTTTACSSSAATTSPRPATARTYSFTAANGFALADHAARSPALAILIDVQGTADISNITVNGVTQVVLVGPPTPKAQCKKGGWKRFNNPSFKNQGQCVSYVAHHSQHGKSSSTR